VQNTKVYVADRRHADCELLQPLSHSVVVTEENESQSARVMQCSSLQQLAANLFHKNKTKQKTKQNKTKQNIERDEGAYALSEDVKLLRAVDIR
jgi:signal transduction histidine kinase